MLQPPYLPIVYVRGYAGSQGEVEDTVADPYMGFNAGATKLRQRWTGDITKHVFESPVVRLMKDYGYRDVFQGVEDPRMKREIPARSIWIYRYYEPVSEDLGSGQRPEIEQYAQGLADFLADMRQRMGAKPSDAGFKVYLVAHSMGGLIVRTYLQALYPKLKKAGKKPVEAEKVFTYATPHGGIDFRLIGNVPSFLQFHNVENFNTGRIRDYLKISKKEVPVNSLDSKYDTEKFFSLIGTNARDYRVLHGLSSAGVGPMSDGLVQIKNAYVDKSPRAFVHRAHSGHYGIVNSEEGYQNMVRFFFGDVRVDGVLKIKNITLPPEIQKIREKEPNKKVRASYHMETVVRVQGAAWDLHRRTVDEHSAILCKYDEVVKAGKNVHLFSSFLSKSEIAQPGKRTMGFAIRLSVLVPEYEVDGFLLFDQHIPGGSIFNDQLNIQLGMTDDKVSLSYGWDSITPMRTSRRADISHKRDEWRCEIPVETRFDPAIEATLELKARRWNDDN